jgi:ATP-dependent Clp protease ATP-binding subunit ClpC
MFERFTDRARRVVVLAQEEARMLNHNYIGTEHILLGLVHEGEGVAAKALEQLGVTEETVRQRVEQIVGRGQQDPPTGRIPFLPRAKKALELSLREALQLGHNYIGTEHILLGLLREGEGPAVTVLTQLGVDLTGVRQRVLQLLHGYQGEQEPAAWGHGKAGRGRGDLLAQIRDQVNSIDARLSALEQRVGTGPDVRDLDREIAQLRRDKEAAIDTQDFETAAALRDKDRELLKAKAARQREWEATHTDLSSLSDELERLRALLRQHGIEPHDGVA